MIIPVVSRFCKEHELFLSGQTVLIACSGGPDSMVLLDVMISVADEFSLALTAAHFNHALRGAESDEDAAFVRDYCASIGIPCLVGIWDDPGADRPSLEARARSARYGFLDESALHTGASRIALGHTAGDQVETVLLHLIRGAGVKGLRGMLPRRDRYVRPLLEITREQIIDHSRSRSVPYRIDPTNQQPKWNRNRIRLNLLPSLREFNPRIVEDIAAMCRILRDEDDYLQKASEASAAGFNTENGVSLKYLRSFHPAVLRRVLKNHLESEICPDVQVQERHIDSILKIIRGSRPCARISLPSGVVFVREYENVRFVLSSSLPIDSPADITVELDQPVAFGKWTFLAEHLATRDQVEEAVIEARKNSLVDVFSTNTLAFPVRICSFRKGDRISPFGFDGTRKVKDVLRESRIPPLERKQWPILRDQKGILWVVGCRRADRAAVTSRTKQAWKITASH